MGNQENFNQAKSIWFITSELEGPRASSFRQERWCRIFLDCGAKVRLFNLRGAFGYCDAEILNHDGLTEFRKDALSKQIGEKNSIREGFFAKPLRRVKHLLLIDLYLPNVVLMFLRINAAIRSEDGNVAIMASSPPFSTAVIGGLLKLLNPKKVILAIDMRDAWAQHKSLGGVKWLKQVIERFILARADFISTVSVGLSREFKREYGFPVEVMYNVATQYFGMQESNVAINWRQISPLIDPNRRLIIYTGSIPEGFYDTDSIVDSMKIISKSYPNLKDKFQFIFIGACDELRRAVLKKLTNNKDFIFVSNISHELIYAAQNNAWALLFFGYLGDDNGGVVSTKLFEYIYSKKPIIPLNICKNSDVDLILKKYCNKSIYLNNRQDIAKCLGEAFIDNGKSLPCASNVNILSELVENYRDYANNVISKL